MCRLIGVVSSETTDFTFSLQRAPRSLAKLSQQHPHGWGLAVHEQGRGWELHKQAACAGEDHRFLEASATAQGELLLAHVRNRTVGPTSVANTHPFQRGPWVFAHNGTVEDVAYLMANTSPARAAEVEGETDSERLFAFLLTLLDENGAGAGSLRSERVPLERALGAALRTMRGRPGFGTCNFLLSDGRILYAHRWGREMLVLDRGLRDAVRAELVSAETAASLEAPWSPRRQAIFVASERLTDEAWFELPAGALVGLAAEPTPRWWLVEEP